MISLVRRFWSTDRSLGILLVSLLLLIFVIQPLGELEVGGRLVTSVFFSLVLISGVGTVAKSGVTTRIVGALVAVTFAVRWIRYWRGGGLLETSDALFSTILCAILALVVLAQVFRAGPITAQRIEGAVAVYLLFGLAWAFAYELVELHWPNSFAQPTLQTPNAQTDLISQFVYFSFVTLTTTGYGDITAQHPVARSLVTMEILVGQLFPTILLARLVSLELYYRQGREGSPPDGAGSML